MPHSDVHYDSLKAAVELDPVSDLKRLVDADRNAAEKVADNGLCGKTYDSTDYRGSLEEDLANVGGCSRTHEDPYYRDQDDERPYDVLREADLDILLFLELLFYEVVIYRKHDRSDDRSDRRVDQEFKDLTKNRRLVEVIAQIDSWNICSKHFQTSLSLAK